MTIAYGILITRTRLTAMMGRANWGSAFSPARYGASRVTLDFGTSGLRILFIWFIASKRGGAKWDCEPCGSVQ
jgi:hypothetical protein